MSSNSEVGDLKNATNFVTLISFAGTYSPSNRAIRLTVLNNKKTTTILDLMDLIRDVFSFLEGQAKFSKRF